MPCTFVLSIALLGVLLNNGVQGKPVEECDAGNEALSGDKGSGYRGCQKVTRGGFTCAFWNSQVPHKHSNTPEKKPNSGLVGSYCRNPDGSDTIWCFTTQPDKRWDYCDPKRTAAECPEELKGHKDSGYRGCQSVTRSGNNCQYWSSQSPHSHDRTPGNFPNSGLDNNYCRNPDGADTIWCYTTQDNTRWEYCDPVAPKDNWIRYIKGNENYLFSSCAGTCSAADNFNNGGPGSIRDDAVMHEGCLRINSCWFTSEGGTEYDKAIDWFARCDWCTCTCEDVRMPDGRWRGLMTDWDRKYNYP